MRFEYLLFSGLACVCLLGYGAWLLARRLKVGEWQTPNAVGLAAVVLYLTSLGLPAFDCGRGVDGAAGFWVLLQGFLGLLTLDPRWFGNVGFFLLLSTMLRNSGPAVYRPKVAAGTGLLALGSLAFPALGCGGGAGGASPSEGLGSGGFLWVGALLLMCGAHVWNHRRSRPSPKIEDAA